MSTKRRIIRLLELLWNQFRARVETFTGVQRSFNVYRKLPNKYEEVSIYFMTNEYMFGLERCSTAYR